MFEQIFKNIDDVLRQEAGCGTELDYTEQTSWMLFLKYLDDLEQERAMEAELVGKPYQFLIDEPHRWSTWAAPKKADGTFDHDNATTDDWHPVVGAEPGVEGYFACFGGSGHGFKLGPPIGESLADIISGQPPRIDLDPLRPSRFSEGALFTSAWGEGNRA